MSGKETDVIVVGAGMAGAAAALKLAKAGQRVKLIEARDRCGPDRFERSHVAHVADTAQHCIGIGQLGKCAIYCCLAPASDDHPVTERLEAVMFRPEKRATA